MLIPTPTLDGGLARPELHPNDDLMSALCGQRIKAIRADFDARAGDGKAMIRTAPGAFCREGPTHG